MKTFFISVVSDFPYNSAQVAGREFTRTPQQLVEHELNDEIRSSPLLVIDEAEELNEPPATAPVVSEPQAPSSAPKSRKRQGD